MIDELLKTFGLKWEDLDTPGHSGEKDQLMNWVTDLQTNQLTVEKIRDYVIKMRESVEIEITKPGLNKEEDMFLKARLRNYMLLEAFLSSSDQAKKAIEQKLMQFKGSVKY